MSILNKEDFATALQKIVGETEDEELLSAVTDITETFNHYETVTAETEAAISKAKEETETEWKKKYRDAFFKQPQKKEYEKTNSGNIKIDDLFKSK